MNEQDKIWLEKCKQQPEKYEISVDNDCISAYESISIGSSSCNSLFVV